MPQNGDGQPDLVVANSGNNTVSVLLGNGTGRFRPPSFATGLSPFSVAAGDVNGDGRPDLVVANESTNSVSVLLGNSNDNFTGRMYTINPAAASTPLPIDPFAVSINRSTLVPSTTKSQTRLQASW